MTFQADHDVWRLKIPIRLSLSPNEISSPVDVSPVYLLAPRHAYLPVLAQQCLSHFQHVLLSLPGQALGSPWFECGGLALNWTQPLGVLHDLLAPTAVAAAGVQQPGAAAGAAAAGGGGAAVAAGPWCLTVHYRDTPASLTNAWQNAGTAKDHFLSSLKEAGYCCRGSDGAAAVMRLPGAAQDALWAAVNKGDGPAARQQLAGLRLAPTPRQGGGVACVPVRLFIRRHAPDTTGLVGVWEQVYSSSRPVEVAQPDGSATLLAHLVHLVMPQAFPRPVSSSRQPAAAAAADQADQQQQQQQQQQEQHQEQQQPEGLPPESDEQPAVAAAGVDPLGAAGSAAAASDVGSGAAASGVPAEVLLPPDWPTNATVFVCGVQPDWRMPLGWLHEHLQAADCFLYVVVHLL